MASASIGFLLDNAAGAEAICQAPLCRHVAALDLPALADRYGRGTTLEQLRPRLRCGRCGGHDVGLKAYATRHGPVT